MKFYVSVSNFQTVAEINKAKCDEDSYEEFFFVDTRIVEEGIEVLCIKQCEVIKINRLYEGINLFDYAFINKQ